MEQKTEGAGANEMRLRRGHLLPGGLYITVSPGDALLTCNPFFDREGPLLQLRTAVVLSEGQLSLFSQREGARCQRIFPPIRFTRTMDPPVRAVRSYVRMELGKQYSFSVALKLRKSSCAFVHQNEHEG